MERLASPQKLILQTNELVLPSKDISGLFRGKVPDVGAGSDFQLIGSYNSRRQSVPLNRLGAAL